MFKKRDKRERNHIRGSGTVHKPKRPTPAKPRWGREEREILTNLRDIGDRLDNSCGEEFDRERYLDALKGLARAMRNPESTSDARAATVFVAFEAERDATGAIDAMFNCAFPMRCEARDLLALADLQHRVRDWAEMETHNAKIDIYGSIVRDNHLHDAQDSTARRYRR